MRLSHLLTAGLLVSAWGAQAAPAVSEPPAPAAKAEAPAPAPGIAQDIVLANHRAVYDLSLAEGGGTRSVESARGRIVIDFRGDACRGYTMLTRQVTELSSGESGPRLSDMRSTTFEGGKGREFRFKTTTLTNNQPAAPVDGTASEQGPGESVTVKLKGAAKPLTVEGPVLFPSEHMRHLIEAARAGQATLSAKVFDGSDDGKKVYDTFAVIGHAGTGPASDTARDKPLREGPLAGMPHWPVRLSYYTAGAGERTPIYTLGFDLYENGVSGALKLDYGEFAILGDMVALDIDAQAGKTAAKEGDKGCTP
ncbi:cell envelope integrity EipB family protein [Methylobacterium sp. J-077]|uniref:cell envelope integrity EipB family protein n=1 Tax=Methylobacterium sp. J-077 TaxID=2836656 RepID=UPI001FB9C474|nr:cell envelope integrity EipB family protein [Methylobacterium sp. J-077]MCJ2124097.1 cell envelope integrity EipB family protein [Methylobacterium sp. J-077]